MKEFFKNKKIMITGGTGSLGKTLVKLLKKYGCEIIIFSRDEGKQALFFGGDPSIVRVIGDVRDLNKLLVTTQRLKPDYIIHTGALKRVDDMEYYPDECVKTNIQGSENVAIAAQTHNVKKCILISTDKACQPVNVYGATKFVAERTYTNYDYNTPGTVFSSIRYGNVIASRGSFIPIWVDKIKNGDMLPVTSMDMTRFLFTLNQAAKAVLSSLYYSEGGEVFVPKIPAYTLNNVIKAIELLNDTKDTPIEIIGVRPGEKLHEDMLSKTELPHTYEVDDNLLAIIPQYGDKTKYSLKTKYEGLEMNSSLCLSEDVKFLAENIKNGLLQ